MAHLVDDPEQRSLRDQARADAIAIARAEDVPWQTICDALGGVARSSAVLRLNVHGSHSPRPTSRATTTDAIPAGAVAIDADVHDAGTSSSIIVEASRSIAHTTTHAAFAAVVDLVSTTPRVDAAHAAKVACAAARAAV